MGWIRDRMEDLEPPVQSLIELAQRVRKAQSWPRAERIKESSLATYLGKFDAGEALEWLEQRPGALQALAEILEMTQEEAGEQLSQLQPPRSSSGARVRLRDVPVRPMDLRRESLPPGIPVQVRDPATWPLWWQASSGAGRTLTGQWLEARGQALFLQAETWAEAVRQLPEQGAVYLVLGSAEGAPLQATWPSGLKLCVATDAPPPRPPEREVERIPREPRELSKASGSRRPAPSVWLSVSSPDARSVLRELLEWVDERITVAGFDREACLRWLETPDILARVDTLGTALGFIGLFATYGKKGEESGLAKARSAADLARLFLRLRLQQSESVEVPFDLLWQRLQHLGQRLLLESEDPGAEVRSMDAWLSLVRMRPDDADLEWLKELERQGLKVDRKSLDKLQAMLPADAFRVVRSLKELSLLRERQPQQLAFQPSWMLAGLIEQALLETLDQGPLAWGNVLLRQEHAPAVFGALLDRCRCGDFTLARAVLQAPDTRNPAWVAALEAIFRVLGLVVLEGNAVPEDLRQGVLRLQRALVVPDAGGLPRPRIAYELPSARESLLVDHRVWYAALLALSETLAPQAELSLDSWCTKPSADARRWLLYMASYRSPQEPRMPEAWLLPLLLLGGRLLDNLGPLAPSSAATPLLLQPERLLRSLQEPEVSLSQLNQAVSWHALGPLLPEYARRRGGDWALCVRKIWAAWLSSSTSDLPSFLYPEEAHAEIFWKYLPPQAVEVLASKRHRHLLGEKEACRFFQAEHWEAFSRVWIEKTEPWGTAPIHALWQRIPAEYVRQAIRAGRPDAHDQMTRKELWQRLPEVFCEEIDALFRQGQWDKALTQVWGAPPSAIPRLLASAKAALEHRGASPPASVIQWLHQMIAQRAPDWSKAWTLLEYLMPPAPV
ncbi:hypothetical protein [Hyalangium minutum]|uniref:Uncharacterized protein n=1 Tax=Hyalangium minutum TaxID=394096 RepID=A0A085W065_9BACT|nr:hypothetical protein [Hyalangium minutum]KFE61078.1 hypothetical protein DB31_4513 [Hyalangium minutum]